MRIVYMGTPEFSVPALEELATHHELALAITRPDSVRARGRALLPTPVKARARALGIPVLETTRLDEGVVSRIQELAPDCIVVAAYGAIIPDSILSIPRFGVINIHASLLPAYRGAAPVQRAILEGETRVGVSIMEVVHALDAGRYCLQESIPVGEKDTEELLYELSHVGARTLLRALVEIENGTVVWQVQDETRVSYAHKIEKKDTLLCLDQPALSLQRRVQASSAEAPARVVIAGKRVRVLRARAIDLDCAQAMCGKVSERAGASDEVLSAGACIFDKHHLCLVCTEGCLQILELKPEGKKAMSVEAWLSGVRDMLSWEGLS